ncbi:Transposon Ty3-I Gag-Pol poly [Biomphalaria glabrata]|nr:Transposon Ty3-I Gag-Pol poly [Biomphalaria glabrata]
MLPLWQPKSLCQGLPKKRQPTVVTSRATEGLTKDSVLNKIAGTCPTVEVLIEGVPLLAMVDTGSQVSTITESFFFRHFQGSVKALQPADIRLTAANGLLIPFVGYFVATISVGDQVLADKAFLVLRDSGSSTQCILGMNVLQDIIGISALIKPGFEQEHNSGQARTTRRPIVVPAWSIQLITATGSNPRLNAELLFEPLETPFHPNLLMVPALTTTEKGHFQLAAVNLSNESVTIRPRTHIGSIHPATLQTGKVEVRLDTISAEIIAYNPLKATPLKGSHIDFSSMISEALVSEERSAMSSLLHSFSDVFAWSDDDLGFTNVIEHKIPLIDETPQAQPYRRLPPSEFQAVKEHIEKLASKDPQQRAFEGLKQALTSTPILGYPDFNLPFVVETDASLDGLGAVLSQQQMEGRKVIAYASRSLRPNERDMKNYSAAKLELLALKWAVTDKFRGYLLGSKFLVFTDNNPLSYIKTAKISSTEHRWVAELDVFDFEIKYRSGKSNSNADALSRFPVAKPSGRDEEEQFVSVYTTRLTTSVPPEVSAGQGLNHDWLITQESTDCLPSLTTPEIHSAQVGDPGIGPVLDLVKRPNSTAHRLPDVCQALLRQKKNTGHSPFELLFGVEPRLPLDSFLGHHQPATSSAGEYLQQHLTRLRALHEHATRVNRKVAAQRDNRVASFPTTRVVIGDLVVLRQHVAGRNKIADRYGSVVYTVLAVPPESGGYFTVQTLDKQITRRVSGTQLKLYVPQAEAIQPPPKPQEIHYERPSSPGVTYSVYRIPLPGAASQPESTPAPAPVGPRRSSRTRRPPTRLDL